MFKASKYHRHAHLGQLRRKEQGAAQILGIAYLNNNSQRLIQQHPGCYLLILRAGWKRDEAGRIHHAGFGQELGCAARHLYGRAGVI
jgi:hypothetical protein